MSRRPNADTIHVSCLVTVTAVAKILHDWRRREWMTIGLPRLYASMNSSRARRANSTEMKVECDTPEYFIQYSTAVQYSLYGSWYDLQTTQAPFLRGFARDPSRTPDRRKAKI